MYRFAKFGILTISVLFTAALVVMVGIASVTSYRWSEDGWQVAMVAGLVCLMALLLAIPLYLLCGRAGPGDLENAAIIWPCQIALVLAGMMLGNSMMPGAYQTYYWAGAMLFMTAVIVVYVRYLWKHVMVLDSRGRVDGVMKAVRKAEVDGEAGFDGQRQIVLVQGASYEAFCEVFDLVSSSIARGVVYDGDYVRLQDVKDARGNDYTGDYKLVKNAKSGWKRTLRRIEAIPPQYLRLVERTGIVPDSE